MTTSTQLMLEACNLYRFFRVADEETLALQGVSLTVAAGETVAVVGPSGSGKSTLLACLAGLDEPAGGSVAVAGKRISHRSERARADIRSARVGVVRQAGNLVHHLTLRENVRLVQQSVRRPGPRRSPEELLTEVGLQGRSSALPRQLSGGELARGGLAVAIANGPDVILADEPTGELDGETEQQILALLGRLAETGVGLLIVTHSRAVTRAADRVIHLHDGRIAL